jgi:hypothetical protein
MPNYDLGLLITLDIGIAMITALGMMIGFWAIAKQNITLAGMAERTVRSTERIAEIAERIDTRLRRQFPDIGDDLR